MPTLSEDLAFRGLIHQVTDPDLLKRLDAGGLTVYAGFDPTAVLCADSNWPATEPSRWPEVGRG
jgi:hypothetical protein